MSTNKAIIHDVAVKRIIAKGVVDNLNAELKIAKATLMEIDTELLHEMSEAQQTLTRVENHTISISSQDVFTPTDWSEFETYCENNHASYLFQRRLSQKAVQELVEKGEELPVEKFTKRSISVRKVAGKV